MEPQRLNILDKPQIKALVEAALFLYGEAMPFAKLAGMLAVNESDISGAVNELQAELEAGRRGIRVLVVGSSAQLVTAPETASLAQTIAKEEFGDALTPAALETLAIIAYRGPLPRSEIDYIRGVNSTFMLRSLLMRGIIARSENPKRPNSFVYALSADAMRMLGLSRIEDLPEYGKYRELNVAEEPKNSEPGVLAPATDALAPKTEGSEPQNIQDPPAPPVAGGAA